MSRKQGMWRPILAIIASLVVLSGSFVGSVAAQDEPQPTQDPAELVDPTLPEQTTPEATEEPEAPEPDSASTPEAAADDEEEQQQSSTATAQRVDTATTVGSPATLAHGLSYYDGDDLVWQVQAIDVPVISEADSLVSEPSIIVQQEGQSIVRNDVTGKRSLLAPGEAYFIASQDSYTLMAEDDGATVWKYTLVDPDDVASDAFYESPTITTVRDNTYNFRLVRYVLQPGDEAELPSNSGAGLLMPSAGEVQVDHGGQLSLLGLDGDQGQGQMLNQPTNIANSSDEPNVVYYLYLGEIVSDESAAPPQSTSSQATSDTTETTQQTGTEAGTDAAADSGSSEGTGEVTSPSDQPADGPYVAQINIYAETEIWLSVTVDGVLWFDGTLPAGQWSGPMNGTTFEVYTSSGASTLFENACGTQFYMGEEPGEAWYTLMADASSCPPPQ